jgi:RimJ/RimL family protein N-acetyltransferase
VRWLLPFTQAVEVAWRLARPYWGRGYATEAARASLDDGFDRLGLAEIVAYTVADNQASWRVMERLGMRRNRDEDFDHPSRPEGHPHRRHLLYRLAR